MKSNIKYIVVTCLLLLLAGCATNGNPCKCEVPGAALVSIFMASDGKPNSNIETLTVYAGQKVVFRGDGVEEFELIFDKDPEDPNKKDKVYRSKDGEIKFKISKKYEDILNSALKQYEAMVVRTKNDSGSTNQVDSIYIKYIIKANNAERDPGIRIITH